MKPITVNPSDRIVPLSGPAEPGALARALCAARLVLGRLRRYMAWQSSIGTLRHMSDRTLRDIGIERGQISDIAWDLVRRRDAGDVRRFPDMPGARPDLPIERDCA